MNDNEIKRLLSSRSSSEQARGIAELVLSGNFSADFVSAVSEFVSDDTPTSFNVPLSAVAKAYLIMAGNDSVDSNDDLTSYMLETFSAV